VRAPDTPGRMRSASCSAMNDTKQKVIRERQFNVAVTSDELKRIHAHAAARGMRPVDYGRARLLAEWRAGGSTSAPHLDPLLLAALSRLGNNLNQIARRLNMLDQPTPPTLEPLLREIRAIINTSTCRDH
jgi:Bacterial mobilisation protein (MobC)